MYPKCLVSSLFIPITIIKEIKANKDDEILGIQYFKNIPVAIASEHNDKIPEVNNAHHNKNPMNLPR